MDRRKKSQDSYLDGFVYLREHFLPALTVSVVIVAGMALAVELLKRLY
jgi:hypothetical protein